MSIFVPKNGLHIDRSMMPQIQSADMEKFIKFLNKKHISVEKKDVPVMSLTPTQGNINTEKVKNLISTDSTSLKKPVLVSKDNYIIDGHHRWLALLNKDKKETIPAIVADVNVQDLLSMAREFPKSFTKNINEFIEFIKEEKEKHFVLTFGRMNPPTTGHGVLVDAVKKLASKLKADYLVVLSGTQDKAKNPLTPEQKLKYAKAFFPNTNLALATKQNPTMLTQAAELYKKGVTNLHVVVGSDRVPEFEKLLKTYNGTESKSLFNFNSIEIHSAGERDPDAEGVTGMSASKMRAAATAGNFKQFRSGVPSNVSDKIAKQMYDDVRKAMHIKEFVKLELTLDDKFDFLLNEGVHDQGIFKAVFLSGGPGSGKDYVLDNTLAGHGLTEINSDKAFEFLMDKENLDMKMPESEREARDLIRGRAKNVTELKQKLAILGRNGLIINGTGDDLEKVKKIKERLEEIGYDTAMVAVNTADEVSKQRNIERGQRGGRTVPEDIRRSKWEGVQKNRPEFAKLFGDKYMEFDNSEDLRTAPEEVKQAKKDEMLDIFKKIREFTKAKPDNEQAQTWIANELSKKDTLNISDKGMDKTAHPESEAYKEAMKLGLTYYGFGRYGKNNQVTYHSVHDKLVPVNKIKVPEPKIPIVGSSMRKKVNEEFSEFINEAVTVTFTADTPEEIQKTIKLLKSDDVEEVKESEEQYELSSPDALNALTLGMPMIKESHNYIKDKEGKPRKFFIRRAAAKEAHQKSGEVVKKDNHYLVKIKEEQNVSDNQTNISGSIQETTRICETCGTDCTCARISEENGSSSCRTTQTEETKKEKITEIDRGIEPGMALSGYNKEKWNSKGEAIPENREKISLNKFMKKRKPVSELTGDETTASIGDQKEDELKKQGISLSSFKKRNYL